MKKTENKFPARVEKMRNDYLLREKDKILEQKENI